MTSNNRHKKRRPHEKQLPALQLPESFLYSKLQSVERQLDTLLVRKRLDIQEALSKSVKTQATLRLHVGHQLNVADDQFSLQIRGYYLSPPGSSTSTTTTSGGAFAKHIKNCLIQLSANGGQVVQWAKSPESAESDGVEVKRSIGGLSQIDCRIFLRLDHQPEKVKLSPALSDLLGLYAETKSAVIMAMWQYIKTHKLQNSSDYRSIECDKALHAVFGCEKFPFTQLPTMLMEHLSPIDPVEISYSFSTVSGETSGEMDHVVDIQVEVDDGVRGHMLKFIMNTAAQKEYAQLDVKIVRTVEEIYMHKLKRDFMHAFAKSPSLFLEKWIASASRDLEVVIGENQVNAEYQRRSGLYHEPWAAEAITHYLSTHSS